MSNWFYNLHLENLFKKKLKRNEKSGESVLSLNFWHMVKIFVFVSRKKYADDGFKID